jgi:hypothetical protein
MFSSSLDFLSLLPGNGDQLRGSIRQLLLPLLHRRRRQKVPAREAAEGRRPTKRKRRKRTQTAAERIGGEERVKRECEEEENRDEHTHPRAGDQFIQFTRTLLIHFNL